MHRRVHCVFRIERVFPSQAPRSTAPLEIHSPRPSSGTLAAYLAGSSLTVQSVTKSGVNGPLCIQSDGGNLTGASEQFTSTLCTPVLRNSSASKDWTSNLVTHLYWG